jgi:hypothetical protein
VNNRNFFYVIVMDNITTVQLTKKTKKRLKSVGMKDETYDDLINRILDDRGV